MSAPAHKQGASYAHTVIAFERRNRGTLLVHDDGISLVDCIYVPGSPDHVHWHRGFVEAIARRDKRAKKVFPPITWLACHPDLLETTPVDPKRFGTRDSRLPTCSFSDAGYGGQVVVDGDYLVLRWWAKDHQYTDPLDGMRVPVALGRTMADAITRALAHPRRKAKP